MAKDWVWFTPSATYCTRLNRKTLALPVGVCLVCLLEKYLNRLKDNNKTLKKVIIMGTFAADQFGVISIQPQLIQSLTYLSQHTDVYNSVSLADIQLKLVVVAEGYSQHML